MKNLIFQALTTLVMFSTLFFGCTNSSKPKAAAETVSQTQWENLFNGENLDGWYTYQMRPEPTSDVPGLSRDKEGHYLEPIGLNNDPLGVFSVVTVDGAPAVRMSGEVFGILVTEKEYENYHLSLQFKWGTSKYPPRKNEKRDSGILYHSIGKEGAWGGVWMRSVECQVQEGDCGDYISVDTVLADIPAVLDVENELFRYSPGSGRLTFSVERSYCHKSEDYENPTGEWNTMEIYTVGGNSIHVVNGHINNRIYNSRHIYHGQELPLAKGKIQLQSEGAEVFYRNIKIEPIDHIPDVL